MEKDKALMLKHYKIVVTGRFLATGEDSENIFSVNPNGEFTGHKEWRLPLFDEEVEEIGEMLYPNQEYIFAVYAYNSNLEDKWQCTFIRKGNCRVLRDLSQEACLTYASQEKLVDSLFQKNV